MQNRGFSWILQNLGQIQHCRRRAPVRLEFSPVLSQTSLQQYYMLLSWVVQSTVTCRSLFPFLFPFSRERIVAAADSGIVSDAGACSGGGGGGGGGDDVSSDSIGNSGKHIELRFDAVRLSRLLLDASSSRGGGGGDGVGGGGGCGSERVTSMPPSPPSSAARRLSRLWTRRQSSRDGRATPRTPTTSKVSRSLQGRYRFCDNMWYVYYLPRVSPSCPPHYIVREEQFPVPVYLRVSVWKLLP